MENPQGIRWDSPLLDDLPEPIRVAVKESPYDWSTAAIRYKLNQLKSPEAVVEFINRVNQSRLAAGEAQKETYL